MLSLGLSLTDAISATTEKPAKWIGMEDQIGCLSAGSFADVAIFDLKDKDFICYIFERGYHPTKHLQNRYQRPLRER